MRVKLPRRLHAVPDLGPYEVNVGALSQAHVGQLVIICLKRNTFTGRLMSVPLESQTKPLLVVQLGDISRGMHPAAKVTVVPDGYRAAVTIEPITDRRTEP